MRRHEIELNDQRNVANDRWRKHLLPLMILVTGGVGMGATEQRG